jgi:NAD(P)-dependent dehydrogenase (short-subunit alcohol dehydrogenase family)
VWHAKRQLSKDGIEDTFATNYLAPFLMTNLLLEILKASSPSRIVNLSSDLHGGTIHFDDIEFTESYNGKKAYIQSKLAVILYSKLLAKKLNGTGVTVNAVHPGLVSTNLGRDFNTIIRGMFRFIGKAPVKGAETSLYVASSSEVEWVSGEYFAGKKITRSSKNSYDMAMAERLWEISEKYVGLK